MVRGFRIRESVEFSEKRKTISLFLFNEISFNHSEDGGVEVLKTFTTSMFYDKKTKKPITIWVGFFKIGSMAVLEKRLVEATNDGKVRILF